MRIIDLSGVWQCAIPDMTKPITIPGTLDETTLTAIVSFQQLMNADFGANLPVIDPANPDLVVDSETLAMLQQITPDMLTPAE